MLRAVAVLAAVTVHAEAFATTPLYLRNSARGSSSAGLCDVSSSLKRFGLSHSNSQIDAREERGGTVACKMSSSSGMSRKEKQKMKKVEKEEQRKVKSNFREVAEKLTDDLMDEVESSKRDVGAITACIEKLNDLQKTLPEGTEAKALPGDWKLAYADTAKTINEFGTGLGGLPGTSVQEMFVSFGEKGALQVFEVCRIVGPFPSVRNKLDGTFDFKKRAAGFAGERVEEEGLSLKYTQLTDGRDKVTTGATGFKVREVRPELQFVSDEILVIKVGGGKLVFEREAALQKELARLLRADLTKEGGQTEEPVSLIENIAQVATGAKSPWDAIFKR